MNHKIQEEIYRYKSEIRARFFSDKTDKFYGLKDKKCFFVFLSGFYQNLGDMAITYAQEYFLKTNFPDYEVVLVPSNKTYHFMKEIKKAVGPKDIITIIGGGNMSEYYESLENARQFIVKSFPENPIISFPQTFDFSESKYGRKRLKKSAACYKKHNQMYIFARERNSFDKMKKSFKNYIDICPDMVLYLDISEPTSNRKGVLCCLRNDKERLLLPEESETIRESLSEKFGDVIFTDTVDVALDDCTPEKFRNTLENFWSLIKSKKVVVTDRLHCMIFCAITGTPCIAFDNSNKKISGIYNEWLTDCNFIKIIDHFDLTELSVEIDNLMNTTDNFSNPCSKNNFNTLINCIKTIINERGSL